MWKSVFESLVPFNLLSSSDSKEFVQTGKIQTYLPEETIINITDSEHDSFFILGKGVVDVISNEGTIIGKIQAPAYFGERSPIFGSPRLFSIHASEESECLQVPGKLLRERFQSNLAFAQSFSSILQDKFHIFEEYKQFIALIDRGKKSNFLNLSHIVDDYRLLNPILHKGSQTDEIDWGALTYVMGRLPREITATCSIFLTEDPPLMYQELLPETRCYIKSDPKRYCHQMMPGKLLFILRDQNTDLIDLVTKLCIYVIESYKIRKRLSPYPHQIHILGKYLLDKEKLQNEEEIWEKLPFSKGERQKLVELFGESALEHLYKIVVQHADISLHFLAPRVRYFSISSEQWILELQKQFKAIGISLEELEDTELHIVSSNTHSIANCLSPWMRKNKEFADQISDDILGSRIDEMNHWDVNYVKARHYFEQHPEKEKEREAFDKEHGFIQMKTTHFTGIQVNIIDLSSLDYDLIDPFLADIKLTEKRKIIVNIDYAYGAEQAAAVMHNMLLMFGKNISSISVIGKSGGVVGERGDLLLPQFSVVQCENALFPITTVDIFPEDFQELNWKKGIHTGTLLTVQGALMQSRETLQFYHHFWNAIGMEMEASHYLKAILRAQQHGVISKTVPLRFAYYTSDTPLLGKEKSLAYQLAAHEGIPCVYAITRVVLKKILSS